MMAWSPMHFRRAQRVLPTLGFSLLAPWAGTAQIAPESARRVRTPDGSVFLLVPRPGRPVVWWASFVRMGTVHEPPGREGLAAACTRASFHGTRIHGTTDPDAEETALREVERARREVREARRGGGEKSVLSKLEQAEVEAKRKAAALASRHRFLELVAELPATIPEIRTLVHGTLVTAAVPPRRLRDFAMLMHDRRRHAVLRGFEASFEHVRRASRARTKTDGTEHLRQACLLALSLHPARRAFVLPGATTPFVPRSEALDFYRRHVRPERSVTVLVGSFEIAEVEPMLQHVFAQRDQGAVGAAPALPEEPPQSGRRSIEIEAAGEPRLTLAWRLTSGSTIGDAEVLATLLAEGAGSELQGKLVNELALASSAAARPRFPGWGHPALFVVELTPARNVPVQRLVAATEEFFGKLRQSGPDAKALTRALAVWAAARRRLFDDRRALAQDLALRMGAHARRELPARIPSAASVHTLVSSLFDPSRMTLVATRETSPGKKGSTR